MAFMRRCWALVPENRPTIETVVDFVREEMKKLGEYYQKRYQKHSNDFLSFSVLHPY
ncbi:hypothetical protein PAXRUDRAFT_835457 [Paxillus rubicundulus Ve08.2h10]|uniref:Serine-threonine/tyrosine-protein kinase catalytic domain-containing protein n=1 Tax=Paxillus rubicundulus Ve08.2h10 TaxID=930991 RepID=A0A0D0BY37_9AGAM|nr:hypothetical protein PAXRUDRAFT_835457 [Paxillus rubicundulus Ve08.2h10]